MSAARLGARLAAVLVASSLAACGSTVPLDERVSTQASDLGDLEPGELNTSVEGAEELPGIGVGGRRGTIDGGQPDSSSTSDRTSSPSAIVRETDPIRLGFIVIDLAGAERVIAGYGTQVSFGDGELEAKALVADLNRHGGIAGRKVLGFYAKVNPASADPAAAYVAACTQLTEDDKVFAIVTVLNVTQGFVDCVAQHKTLLINVSFNPGDDAILKQHRDWFFSPSFMSLDRGTALLLKVVRAQGRLRKGAKVGVLVNDADPQLPRVSNATVKPLLRAWKVPFIESTTAGQRGSDIAGAALRFAAEGVNRVIFVAPNGLVQLQFMNFAEDQSYRPQYFFWDPDSPKFVSETAPTAQARNISGMGALPVSDVPPTQYPSNAEERRCLEIIREAGEDSTDRNSNLASTLYCEGVWVFQAVTERTTGALTASSWREAYRRTGTAYRPVSTFAIDFANGRNDNASHFRTLAWKEACPCLTYTSPSQLAR